MGRHAIFGLTAKNARNAKKERREVVHLGHLLFKWVKFRTHTKVVETYETIGSGGVGWCKQAYGTALGTAPQKLIQCDSWLFSRDKDSRAHKDRRTRVKSYRKA
jgi:hypothetical protein